MLIVHHAVPHMTKFCTALLISLLICCSAKAQTWSDKETIPWLMSRICVLADTGMHGRGYVKGGREKAATYIQKQFKAYHLQPVGVNKSYLQPYYFPVNTFPGKMELSFNHNKLKAGKDFIIDAKSAAFSRNNMKVEKTDLATITTAAQWKKTLVTLSNATKMHYLVNIDSMCKGLKIRRTNVVSELPKGCFIIPQKDKFIWTVARTAIKATVFYVDTATAAINMETADVQVQAKLLPKAKSDNIIGIVPGEVKDSFIFVTAHYDHLGMMGNKAIFTGASDNASGTAMLLYLANYFHARPQHYSIVFIAFSGEEAGLMGSKYFTKHPLLPLKKIKFLTNIDIMGDATDGITVVNATEYPAQFNMLQDINTKYNYLPQVRSRGKAANSDHYHFTEAGVPSFFIYTNGGKGYYHDIYDSAESLSMTGIDKIAQLLIDFIGEIK